MERMAEALSTRHEKQDQLNRLLALQAIWKQLEFFIEASSATQLRQMIEDLLLDRGDFRVDDFEWELMRIEMDDFSRKLIKELLSFLT